MIRLIALSLFLVVLFSELALRLFFAPPRLISFVEHDFELGHRGPKNEKLSVWGNPVTYGKEGFRILPNEQSDLPLTLWLGDSMVEAITIPDDKHFLEILSRTTKSRNKILAAGDWSTTQEFLAFRSYGKSLHPRLVVLAFSSLTDFVNNHSVFAHRYQSHVDGLRPYARVDDDGGFDIFRVAPLYYALRKVSRIFLTVDNLRIARNLASPIEALPDCEKNVHAVPVEGYFTDDDVEWKASVDLTARLFRELKEEAESAGARFALVFLPSDIDLKKEKWEAALAFSRNCHPKRPLDRRGIERKFLVAAEAAGVLHLSLFDPVEEELRAGRDPFLPDGHFNEAGHAFIAKRLSAWLDQIMGESPGASAKD